MTGLKGEYQLYPNVILKCLPKDESLFFNKEELLIMTEIEVE